MKYIKNGIAIFLGTCFAIHVLDSGLQSIYSILGFALVYFLFEVLDETIATR